MATRERIREYKRTDRKADTGELSAAVFTANRPQVFLPAALQPLRAANEMLDCVNAGELEDQWLADETQSQVVEGGAHAICGKIAEVDGVGTAFNYLALRFVG